MPLSALPHFLARHEAQGAFVGEPIAQFEIGSMRNLVYLVIDWATRRCAWVDPQSDLSEPLGAIETHGLELERILLTHSHHDHIAGLPELARRWQDVPIHCGREDLHRLPAQLRSSPRVHGLSEGDRLTVGRLELRCLATPGHSAGAISYLFEAGGRPWLLTGDTIFVRDCGRTDLPTGSTEELFATLQRVRKLAPETVLLPGHHYAPEVATTLGAELQSSPPFQCRTSAELEALP
jgi:hydroxyacylglutathione hydrolase